MTQIATTAAHLATALAPEQLQGSYQERLLRINVVVFLTGLSRGVIYRRMDAGDFPLALRVHGKCVAWKESEVNAWIQNLQPITQPAKKEEQ